MSSSLARAYLAGDPRRVVSDDELARLDVLLRRKLEGAAAAWPGLSIPEEAVVALWAERRDPASTAPLETEIDAVPGADLYIACGCGLGDQAALRAFEARHLVDLGAALARVTTSPAAVAEVKQMVRETLFVALPGQRSRIVELAGRGELGGLVRVIAIRAALNLRRADDRLVSADEPGVLGSLAAEADVELAAIKGEHRLLIKRAFEAALAGLTPRDRNLLRMHLLHRLAIDAIGRAHGVHRATAARWLERIRADLRVATLRVLRTELGLADADLESLIQVVESRLDVSFHRILTPP